MGKWAKGQSGNPKGGRKVNLELVDAARAHCHEAIRVLGMIMSSKLEDSRDRIRAAEILLDRGYGRAPQAVELSGPGGKPIETKAHGVDPDQLPAILGILEGLGVVPPPPPEGSEAAPAGGDPAP